MSERRKYEKTTVTILILALAVALLASCSEQEIPDTSANISESSVAESSVIESNTEKSGAVTANPEVITYNPDSKVHDVIYEMTTVFIEQNHAALYAYIAENENLTDDTYFCVNLYKGNKDQSVDDLLSYLEDIGFIYDQELTDKINGSDHYAGYINKTTYKKLAEDNYAIYLEWLSLDCIEGRCNIH